MIPIVDGGAEVRQRFRTVLGIAAVLGSLPLAAGDRRVDELTDLERMERRLAPGDAEYRRTRAIAENRVGKTDGYVVDGARDPELLMAWEIMSHLSGAFGTDEATFSSVVERWRQRGAAKHLGHDDFVTQLRAVVGTYVDAESESRQIQVKLANAGPGEHEALRARKSEIHKSLCRLRADALSEGRRMFGHGNFQRFLYEAVAPDVVIVSSAASSPEASTQLWQWFEEGCR